MYPAFLRKLTEKNARKAKLASRLLDMVRFRRSSSESDLLSVSQRRLLGLRLAPLNKRILRTERQQIASAAPAVPTIGSLRRALVSRDRVRDGRVVLRFLYDCVCNLVLLGSDAITLDAGRSSQALMPARRVPEPVE
jgi:hypothetical protein